MVARSTPAPLEIGHAPPGRHAPRSCAWNQADAAALAACSRWPDSACACDCAVRRGAGTPVSSASRFSASAEAQTLELHDEVDGGAVRAAAEAVIEALVLDHVERGRLLLVERAQAQMLAPAPRQLDVAADDLDQRQAGLEFLERGVGSGQSATFGLLDASGHHDRKRAIRAGCRACAARERTSRPFLDTSSDAQYRTGAARTPRWHSRTGRCFVGFGGGCPGIHVGELVFNTAITGYQEILTDPSYAGQIVTFTFPHIGNVGTNDEDIEALTPYARGMVSRAPITDPSNWRSGGHLDDLARERAGIAAIGGVDTRRITRILRENGAQNAALAYLPDAELDLDDLKARATRLARAWKAWTSPARSPAASATAGTRPAGRGARAMAAATARARTSWRSTTASSATSCAVSRAWAAG